jgi:hypothetical protein
MEIREVIQISMTGPESHPVPGGRWCFGNLYSPARSQAFDQTVSDAPFDFARTRAQYTRITPPRTLKS